MLPNDAGQPMVKRQSRIIVKQKIAVAVFCTLAIGIVAYLTWVTIADAPLGEFVEGEHYQLIEKPRRIRSDKIEVMEFFSYACVHCYNFDPMLADWLEEKGDQVNFVPVPAVANDTWRLLGRNFYTLQELGLLDQFHMAFFRAIHESRQVFNSPEKIFDYFSRAGIEDDTYETAFRSAAVNTKLSRADQMARRLKVSAVPSIVIQGKYLVRTTGSIGPKRMLDVMDYLIEKEQGRP